MTLKDIVIEVFEALGEPTDLDFWSDRDTQTVNTDSSGWKRLVDQVNSACMALSMWKWPTGRQVRMRFPYGEAILKPLILSGTLSGNTSMWSVTGLDAGFGLHVDKLMVGQTSGAKGVVYWSKDTTLLVAQVSGTFQSGETVKLYRRKFPWKSVSSGYSLSSVDGIPYLPGQGSPLEIIGVRDIGNQTQLDRSYRGDFLPTPEPNEGVPLTFDVLANGLVFDVWPTDGLLFNVQYMRGPRKLGYEDSDEEPELPEQFHQGLVLWCEWWGLRRAQESNDAYSVKKDLDDFMARTRTEYDLQDEHAQGQITIYPEGK